MSRAGSWASPGSAPATPRCPRAWDSGPHLARIDPFDRHPVAHLFESRPRPQARDDRQTSPGSVFSTSRKFVVNTVRRRSL